jgi:hypothetical protein
LRAVVLELMEYTATILRHKGTEQLKVMVHREIEDPDATLLLSKVGKYMDGISDSLAARNDCERWLDYPKT